MNECIERLEVNISFCDLILVCLWLKVLSVTYVRGGTAFNIIPPFVEFGGTLRSLTTEGLYQLQKRLKEVYNIT